MIDTNEDMFFDKIKNVFKEVLASVSMTKQEEEIEPVNEIDLEEQTPQEPAVEPQPTVEEPNEPKVEETVVEEPKEPEVVEEPKPTEEPKVEEAKTDPHLEELINSLKEEVEALKKMNSGLNNKVKELSKMPSAAPVNTNAKPIQGEGGVNGSAYQNWREAMRQMVS